MKPDGSTNLRQQVHDEHAELREALREMHRSLANRQEKPDEIAVRLEDLVDHVRTHFHEEEEDAGFFAQIIEVAPRLQPAVQNLRNGHVRLLELVEGLQSDTAGSTELRPGAAGWWERLEKGFHAFSKELMQHETDEMELLLEAYDSDIGDKD